MGDDSSVAPGCYAAALSALPGMGPTYLGAILGEHHPRDAWEAVASGRIERPRARGQDLGGVLDFPGVDAPGVDAPGARSKKPWRTLAASVDPVRWWTVISQRGIFVTWRGQVDYPSALTDDPNPPAVIFWRGRIKSLSAPCVAVVGTRHPSRDGSGVAFEMGRDLTAAGVCVVSGLALGIDGAAHRGALEGLRSGSGAPPVGVVASGVDVVYPKAHSGLWEGVVLTGAIISETIPGRPAQAWRFPARNRVIAGLVKQVVVVESHTRGGSLITVEAALQRGVEVGAVPGSVHSDASVGSNQLLFDGASVIRDASDVLSYLGLFTSGGPSRSDRVEQERNRGVHDPGPHGDRARGRGRSSDVRSEQALDVISRRVLEAMGWRPITTNQIITETGLGTPEVMRSLDVLTGVGAVTEDEGCYTRVS